MSVFKTKSIKKNKKVTLDKFKSNVVTLFSEIFDPNDPNDPNECNNTMTHNKPKSKNILNITYGNVTLITSLKYGIFVLYDKIFLQKQLAQKYYNLFESHIEYDNNSHIKIYGKTILIPRKQVAYGDVGTSYTFSGTIVKAKNWHDGSVISKIFLSLRDRLAKQFGIPFNFVLINRYNDGNEYIGYHSDDEKDLDKNPSIVGITFGSQRDFLFKSKTTGEVVKLTLHNGSMVAMLYPTNAGWMHSVPKRKNVKHPRISLTFRYMPQDNK
jgi:alkylated DNA repair dioxygenase AlkB